MMKLIFGLAYLVGYAMAYNVPSPIPPGYLDQLQRDGRYEEFAHILGLPRVDLARPSKDTDPKRDPMFTKGLFQGDMILTPTQEVFFEQARQAIKTSFRPNIRWSGNPAIMYYEISNNDFDQTEYSLINEIIADWNNTHPCIKMAPRKPDTKDYIHIYAGNGCQSSVGRRGGSQGLSLGKDCVITQSIKHEFTHAAGLEHEHSRQDRDDYIEIIWENIREIGRNDYKILDDDYELLGPYDYYSITHYSNTVWTIGDNRAFNVLNDTVDKHLVGHTSKFSDLDIIKTNVMYC